MNTHSRTYQSIYIIIATILSTITLFYYAKALPELIPNDNLTKEMIMCSGQLVWQGCIILVFIKRKILLYLFHMITVSLLGSFALIPMILYYQQEPTTMEIRIALFLFIVCLMIIEHARRVKR